MAMGPILGQERRKRRTPMAEINVTSTIGVTLISDIGVRRLRRS